MLYDKLHLALKKACPFRRIHIRFEENGKKKLLQKIAEM
jgi:hypothetical protein